MTTPETERPGEAQGPANAGDLQGNRFKPGTSGNPGGRPAGSRNRASLLLDQLAEGEAEAVLRAVVESARSGDLRAAELILARAWPVKRGRPIALDLPAVSSAEDVGVALAATVQAMAGGQITPDDAGAVTSVLMSRLKIIEVEDHERRLAALEEALAHAGKDAAPDEAHL